VNATTGADKVWLGKALCVPTPRNKEYEKGFRGAILVFACLATDIVHCVNLLSAECADNELVLNGFEYLFDKTYMDREPSDYEEQLVSKLSKYPVQFENVHFFKSDA
jgi:hypothetical protein